MVICASKGVNFKLHIILVFFRPKYKKICIISKDSKYNRPASGQKKVLSGLQKVQLYPFTTLKEVLKWDNSEGRGLYPPCFGLVLLHLHIQGFGLQKVIQKIFYNRSTNSAAFEHYSECLFHPSMKLNLLALFYFKYLTIKGWNFSKSGNS